MSICGFWRSEFRVDILAKRNEASRLGKPYRCSALSTMIVIALNQMDTSEEATIYLKRLISGLIGAPFTLCSTTQASRS